MISLRAIVLSLVCLSICAVLVSAQEEEKMDRSPEVERSPAAKEFLIVPLRMYRLKSKSNADADCSLSDADFTRILGKANRIWSFAGIYFSCEKPLEIEAEELPKEDQDSDAAKIEALPLSRRSRALIPEPTRDFAGFRVYYIHSFDVNGIYYGRREAMVKETAALRGVPGGIDEPIPRVTAHELGHGLSLPHRQEKTNLMASGTSGTTLNEAEVEQTRAAALKLDATLTFEKLFGRMDSEQDQERRETMKRWIAEIRTLAASE